MLLDLRVQPASVDLLACPEAQVKTDLLCLVARARLLKTTAKRVITGSISALLNSAFSRSQERDGRGLPALGNPAETLRSLFRLAVGLAVVVAKVTRKTRQRCH